MTLASWVTSIRFLLAPLIYWWLVSGTSWGIGGAVVFLTLAALSDVVDGWVARARNEVSELGKVIDPLADKLVIVAALLGLAGAWGLPYWMVFLYLAKELVQVLAGLFLIRKFKQVIPANQWGKAATFVFFAGFGLFFIHRMAGTVVLGAAVLLSVYALYTYYRVYRRLK